MTGQVRNRDRSHKQIKQTYTSRSKNTVTKSYVVERKPRYPYPVYAKFWIQDFRAPRLIPLLLCGSSDKLNNNSSGKNDNMGVTTVIKDYGTEILDAIRQNNLQKLQLILEKQLKSDSKISKLCVTDIKHKPSKKFACPLILAARQEDPTILHYMMEKGTDPNFIHHTIYSSKRREIVTALHIAVDLGYYENVEVLLSVNAHCNIGDHNQETPLHIAVKKADQVMARMLLSKGADPTIPDRHGNAALHTATLYGHLQLCKILLRYDADIFQKGQYDAIAPHIAAKEGHIHLIQLFCSRYIGNINVKIPCFIDGREKAPVHLTAENGHIETLKALLDQFDAEVNIKDSDGNTPLHCCVLNPYDPHRLREKEDFNDTAKTLLKHRVSVNSKNAFGDSALHLAAMNHFQRIVEMLLEVGANPFIENNQKLKPIDVVPSDDPVTLQVLKMAMMQGPRPLKYPSADSIMEKDSSSGNLSSGQNTVSTKNQVSIQIGPDGTTDTGVGSSENMLDRSLSIRSSTSTLPSVFGGGEEHHRQNGRHPHMPLPAPPSNAREGLKTRDGQRDERKPHGRDQGQQTTEKEMPVYTKMGDIKPSAGRGQYDKRIGRHESFDESSTQEDTYSLMSQSTTCESGTQTRKKRGRDVGIMARRDRKKSVNKRLQTSFDLDASITYNTMSSQTDLQSYADLQSMIDFQSELSLQNIDMHSKQYGSRSQDHRRGKHKHNKGKHGEFEDDTIVYANLSDDKKKGVPKSGSKHKLEKTQSNQRKKKSRSSTEFDDDEYETQSEESETESDYDDETQITQSQVTPYRSKKKAAKQAGNTNMPPGSVRVNTLPGKPGTIELQYTGGPLTIALDTQAFSNNTVQPDQQGEFFYDKQGNKYPASMIYALQQAAGMMGANQGQVPLVTTQTGENIQHIFKTPERPYKANTTTASPKSGKPRAPSPKSDKEKVYANQDEINAMLNGSPDNTGLGDVSLESPSDQVKTAIHQSVHEVTKTPEKDSRVLMSPTSSQGRSTPTRPSKQHDHLRKILGRSTPTKRGTTPTKLELGEQKVFEFDPPLAVQEPEESSSEEESDDEEEDEEEDEFEEAVEEQFSPPPPPLPISQPPPPKPQPPQIQPRRSLQQTPVLNESEKIQETTTITTTTTEEIVQKASSINRKHPEKPLIISRADQSFEAADEDDDNVSPDQWDETPNVSPQHKSFSQKLAWAKALEEGKAPLQLEEYQDNDEYVVTGKKSKVKKIPRNATEHTNEVEENLQATETKQRRSKSKKIRPPLSPGYKRAVGGVIREEDEDIEDEVLPEYIKSSNQYDTSSEEEEEDDEDEEESSEEEDSEDESEDEDQVVIEANQPNKAHDKYYSITPVDVQETGSTSSSKTSGSGITVVKPANELTTTITTETVTVVTTETHDNKLEKLKAEAILKQQSDELGEYEVEPGSHRLYRIHSPTGNRDRDFSPVGGRQTPDSLYSEGSISGRGLNMRVTGDTPKAYSRKEKDIKRLEWMKAKPVGIESGSEYSDNEFGSVNSLNRSLSPGGQERSRKWSEENKPVYKKRKPYDVSGQQAGQPREHGKPPDGKSKGKIIGAYAKPYKSFGKIETKTDLLEEAMLTSPISPMSPIHTSIPEELETFGTEDEYGSTEVIETIIEKQVVQKAGETHSTVNENQIKKQLRTSPARFLETDPEKAQPMDSDEGPNIDSANTSVAESSFKKNIKLAEPGPELHETETIEQPVSIGASEEDLLKAAEILDRQTTRTKKTKSVTVKERKMTDDGEIIETVTTTVLATKTEEPQVGSLLIINNDGDDFEDETSESEEDDEEEIGEYDREPGARRPKQKQKDKKVFDSNEVFEETGQYDPEPGAKKPQNKPETDDSYLNDEDQEIGKYDREPGARRPKSKSRDDSVMQVEIVETNLDSPEDTESIEMYGDEPGVRKPKKVETITITETTTTQPDINESSHITSENQDTLINSESKLKQKSPFEEFTESPVKKTKVKKVKKVKKKKKEESPQVENSQADPIVDVDDIPFIEVDQSMEIETTGNESEVRKVKKKKKKSRKGSAPEEIIIATETETIITKSAHQRTIDDEFNPDVEVKLYNEESGEYKPKKLKTQVIEETNYKSIQKDVQNTFEPYDSEPSTKAHQEDSEEVGFNEQQNEPNETQESQLLPQQKQTFETSFGPEDEEVAQINIAAAERKKKKKEKKKKIKKQEDIWAEQQKKAFEKKQKEQEESALLAAQQQQQLQQQQIEETIETTQETFTTELNPQDATAKNFAQGHPQQAIINGVPLQYGQDPSQLTATHAQEKPPTTYEQPMPAAEITFSGGIQVIDETHKSKKKKKKVDADVTGEDGDKSKKKKKKKGEKTTKKKKKGTTESVESLDDIVAETNQDSYKEDMAHNVDVNEDEVVKHNGVVIRSSITTETAIDDPFETAIDEPFESKYALETAIDQPIESKHNLETSIDEPFETENIIHTSHQLSGELSEGELNKSGMSTDDQTGIHGTVMGAKVERNDTIKKMDLINMDRVPVRKRQKDVSEESESEYSEEEIEDELSQSDVASSTQAVVEETIEPVAVNDNKDREEVMWQQYHLQQQASMEMAKNRKAAHQDIKETDIDADIIETNIDDDLPEPPEENEDMDEEEEPLPTGNFQREYGARRSMGRRKHKKREPQPENVTETNEQHLVEAKEVPGSIDTTTTTTTRETLMTTTTEKFKRPHGKSKYIRPKAISHGSSMPLEQGPLQTASKPEGIYENDNDEQHSWKDQKEQEEKMKQMLMSYNQDYDAASMDSDQYATIEYGNDPQMKPHRDSHQPPQVPPGRDDPRYHSLPTQPTYDMKEQPYRNNRRPRDQKQRNDEDMMAQMWAQQHGRPVDHRRPRQSEPVDQYGDPRRPRRADSKGHTSDTETMADRKRRKKKLKFIEDVHSEAEIHDLDPLQVEPGKSLQEAAMETLTASLKNQPKLTPRKPLESVHKEKPINYTRGVYRPQPVYWRGSRGTQSLSSTGRYNDSQLMTQMWSEQYPQGGGGTESEGDVENEYLEPVNVRRTIPRAQSDMGEYSPEMGQYPPNMYPDDNMNDNDNVHHPTGAFQPFSPYRPKHVIIHDERRRREEREAAQRERVRRKKDRAPKVNAGPVDFTKYPTTAKIWMEQVDKETVQKSKTMYLSVMPEGMKPPPEIENNVPSMENLSPEDIFLPPQWVIARGRSLRLRKRRFDSSQRESMGSMSGVTSGESDFEDRPDSPGEQMLLFFRVGNNWTDLVWILFEGMLNEDQTRRMITDIQLKYPRNLSGQVNNFMHRWWKKKGRAATIEELRRALDIGGMPYIQEEFFDKRQMVMSNTDTEDDLNISELSDNDPEVSRLIQEYEVRSLNTSYIDPGEHGHHKTSMSGDGLLRKLENMEEKGAHIDRSHITSHLSTNSHDSVFKRNSQMDYEDDMDDYGSDLDTSRRAFVIVQPQLKHKDYNYETQI